jgi:hypothetical protein
VSPTPDPIRLLDPRSKCFVELVRGRDPKLMDEETLGVCRHPQDPLVMQLVLQVEESIEGQLARLGTGKATVGPL